MMASPISLKNPTLIGHSALAKPRRTWRNKLRDALRGLKLGIRGHSSFSVHFFFAALVLAAGIALRCDRADWCILVGCIGMVLTAELFNSALEMLVRGLDEAVTAEVRASLHVGASLDIAAGAVLLASIVAAILGASVFVSRLLALLA
jgi:diacylglycerol kinase